MLFYSGHVIILFTANVRVTSVWAEKNNPLRRTHMHAQGMETGMEAGGREMGSQADREERYVLIYSVVSSPLDCSKHFTFHHGRPVHSNSISTSLGSIHFIC